MVFKVFDKEVANLSLFGDMPNYFLFELKSWNGKFDYNSIKFAPFETGKYTHISGKKQAIQAVARFPIVF